MTAAPVNAGTERNDRADRAERVAAGVTGVGVGLLGFMIAWLVGARVTERIWGPPSSAVVALATSVVVGIVVTVVASHRLRRRALAESQLAREATQRD